MECTGRMDCQGKEILMGWMTENGECLSRRDGACKGIVGCIGLSLKEKGNED